MSLKENHVEKNCGRSIIIDQECGKQTPSFPLLLDIAETLGVDVARLVSDDR